MNMIIRYPVSYGIWIMRGLYKEEGIRYDLYKEEGIRLICIKRRVSDMRRVSDTYDLHTKESIKSGWSMR